MGDKVVVSASDMAAMSASDMAAMSGEFVKIGSNL